MQKLILALCLVATSVACTDNNTQYHSVADKSWQQLSAEQRQLVIDKSFRDSVHPDSPAFSKEEGDARG